MIKLTIDGREVQAEPGMYIYQAAKAAGIDIPIFCYHPRMKPVAACRMCLVKVEKMPKLQTACSTPVAEGMVVWTNTDEVKKAQQGVLEFLLAQHPLDCPICDKGGECPLQDTSFKYGPPHTRFSERKRHLDKARALGPLVVLDQERCIQCQRCTRFCEEIVGDPVLTLQNRGADTVVDLAEGRIFDSIYSGNTIEICPVGALTSRTYRFRARPWDIVPMASICPHCPVGCNITVSVRETDVMRILSRENEEIDQGWLCDRGRFGYGFLDDERRLFQPLVRKDGELVEVGWDEALEVIRKGVAGKKLAALGGARLSTEALFTWKAYLDQLGAEYDWRVHGEATAIAPGPRTLIRDVDDADLFLFLDAAPLEEVPVLHLRIRHRVVNERGAKVLVVGPRRLGTDLPHRAVLVRPGEHRTVLPAILAGGRDPEIRELLLDAKKCIVLWDGKDAQTIPVLEQLLTLRGERFTGVLVTGGQTNARGAQVVGFQPMEAPRRTSREILTALREGSLEALFVLAEDLLEVYPDGELVRQALAKRPFLVEIGYFPSKTSAFADVVLPLAAFTESSGSFVNLEGRRQAYEPVVAPPEGLVADYAIPALLLGQKVDVADVRRQLLKAHPELADVSQRDLPLRLPRMDETSYGDVVVVPSLYRRGIVPERHLPHLAAKAEVMVVEPGTAEALGLADGDEVAVVTEFGEHRAVVECSSRVVAGVVFLSDGIAGANFVRQPREAIRLLIRRDA